MGIGHTIRRIVRRCGYDVIRYSPIKPATARIVRILDDHDIDIVLDVGANAGQYAKKLRDAKYRGKILSFEPLISVYKELKDNARNDKFWDVYNFALGDKEETALMNIAGNSYSSSLLDMLPSHVNSAPESKYVGQEKVEIKTLDSLFSSLCSRTDRVFLKIDTQGYEKNVIEGAKESLESIDYIQLEMSLIPLYKDELLFNEMCIKLNQIGYSLISIERGFTDKDTGRLLQIDGIFCRF